MAKYRRPRLANRLVQHLLKHNHYNKLKKLTKKMKTKPIAASSDILNQLMKTAKHRLKTTKG